MCTMLFIPKAINAKSLLHQLKAPSKSLCVSKLQLSSRAMLFSNCCVVRVMKVTPSLNWWPSWTTWCSSIWKSSAGSLCRAISLMRQMESASRFILLYVSSRSMPGILSAIISFRSFQTRRTRAFWLLLSNRTRLQGLKFFRLAWTCLQTWTEWWEDLTALLTQDGQNTAAAGMAGDSMFSSQHDFNLVCVRLDWKCTTTSASELIRTGKHVTHKWVLFGHGSILLQNAKHIQIGEKNHQA